MTWDETFLSLYDRCVGAYQSGNKDYESYYSDEDLEFLESIGYKKREFFDFIEDFCEEGTPSPSTALLVAAARRDFFLVVQNEEPSTGKPLTRDEIPSFGEEFEGIAYFPRILAKARAKLRGELDPDLMYGCGGDRNFLKKNGNIHPADFLRQCWSAEENESQLADWVKSQAEGLED